MADAARLATAHDTDERVVGDYILKRRLGSGAMGEVWLAWHRRSEGRAAVKLLVEHPKLRGRALRFFDREHRAIARLDHPNIIGLYDVGPGFIAMAYVDGPNLASRLDSGLQPAFALRVWLQIASALAHAHARGVVHRDVKPSNVLLDRHGNAYLGDFGLALIADDGDADGTDLRVGTPGYMAPELLRGLEATPASDQFALARTLLELLAGRLPTTHPDEALRHLPADTPASLTGALRRALDVDPGARFPSVEAFAAALEGVVVDGLSLADDLAPEVRMRAPFAWAVASTRIVSVSPEIARADYTLSALVEAGLVRSDAATEVLRQFAARELGFSVWAHAGRLGAPSDSGAFARATDLVVLLHGTLCDRSIWAGLAACICRNNPRAVVLAPDMLGSGDSPFDADQFSDQTVAPTQVLRAVLAWLELLNLRDLPTVLLGHSYSGVAVLSVTDEEVGERTSRIALTPVFPAVDRRLRITLRGTSALLSLLRRVPSLYARAGRWMLVHGPDTARYTLEDRQRMVACFEQLPNRVLCSLTRELGRAQGAATDRLDRCLVVISDDDPLISEERASKSISKLGLPARSVVRLSGGGHLPHAVNPEQPGATTRNVAELAQVVESMLVSSREGASFSTQIESTALDMGRSAAVSDPASG